MSMPPNSRDGYVFDPWNRVEVADVRLADGRAPADARTSAAVFFRQPPCLAIVDDDVGTFRAISIANPSTDAARRAGDERDLPVKLSHASVCR